MWFGRSSSRQNPHAQPATPQHESGPASRSGLSRERGHLARMDKRPALPGRRPSVLSREIVVTVRYSPCGPEGHRLAKTLMPSRPPRNMKVARHHGAACPGSAGILPAWTTAGLRPVAGQRPALPGRRPMRTFTGNCRNGSVALLFRNPVQPELCVGGGRRGEGLGARTGDRPSTPVQNVLQRLRRRVRFRTLRELRRNEHGIAGRPELHALGVLLEVLRIRRHS